MNIEKAKKVAPVLIGLLESPNADKDAVIDTFGLFSLLFGISFADVKKVCRWMEQLELNDFRNDIRKMVNDMLSEI